MNSNVLKSKTFFAFFLIIILTILFISSCSSKQKLTGKVRNNRYYHDVYQISLEAPSDFWTFFERVNGKYTDVGIEKWITGSKILLYRKPIMNDATFNNEFSGYAMGFVKNRSKNLVNVLSKKEKDLFVVFDALRYEFSGDKFNEKLGIKEPIKEIIYFFKHNSNLYILLITGQQEFVDYDRNDFNKVISNFYFE